MSLADHFPTPGFAVAADIARILAEAPVATFSTPTSRGYVVVKAQAIAGGVRVELRLVGVGPILPDALTSEEYVQIVERARRAFRALPGTGGHEL